MGGKHDIAQGVNSPLVRSLDSNPPIMGYQCFALRLPVGLWSGLLRPAACLELLRGYAGNPLPERRT